MARMTTHIMSGHGSGAIMKRPRELQQTAKSRNVAVGMMYTL